MKKTIKSIAALLLALLILLMPLSVAAEEITEPDLLLEARSLNTELTAGETVKLTVAATVNEGYAYGSARITWDNEALELTAVEYTALAPNNRSSAINNSGAYTVRFGNNLATTDFTGTGVFFTLVFKITELAHANTYNIDISKLSVANARDNELRAYALSGTITLSSIDAGLVLSLEDAEMDLKEEDTVRVPVTANKNIGYQNAAVLISYNEDVFTLSDVEYSSFAPNNGSSADSTAGNYMIKIGTKDGVEHYGLGTAFTLVFAAKSGISTGLYSVNLSAAYAVNGFDETIQCSLHSGTITVYDSTAIEDDPYTPPVTPPDDPGTPDIPPVISDYDGTVGDCTWHFDAASGTLTIAGNGAMANYGNASSAPYKKFGDAIQKVCINSGVTSIGDFAFSCLSGLEEVDIASTVTYIGESAFEDTCLTDISVSPSVTEIGDYAIGYFINGKDESGDTIHQKVGTMTIECWSGTAAHTYAIENNIDVRIRTDILASIRYIVPQFSGVSTTITMKSDTAAYDIAAADGVFALDNVESGVYRVYAKQKNTLTVCLGEYDTGSGEVVNHDDVLLPLGDVNGDDVIDVADVSVMLAAENYAQVNAAINLFGDTTITIEDIGVILNEANYGKRSVSVV
ncbi:MAG: leucine-rich repeat protein [Clostridia bacterium]|nr:leucine-rich repeat protein [Clostridia bacterium]